MWPRQSFILLLAQLGACSVADTNHVRVQLTTKHALDSALANIHIATTGTSVSNIDVTYGGCGREATDSIHHHVKRNFDSGGVSRLIWMIPADAPIEGCLSAWDVATSKLLGRSEMLSLHTAKRKRRRDLESIKMTKPDFELDGPWFNGVAYLKDRNISHTDEKVAKGKKIGIIGGGMSGLMISLLLDSVGIHNWEIQESSHRVGGRIRTVYLEGKPDDYQYQEMGPMRFPYEATYPGADKPLRVKDHQLVFDLVDELNKKNKKKNPELLIKFIDFVNSENPNVPLYMNGIRNEDGSIPTAGEAVTDPRFATQSSPEIAALQQSIAAKFTSQQNLTEFITNMFEAHKKFIDNGWDDWSEFAYVHQHLNKSLDVTALVAMASTGPDTSYWALLFESSYFTSTTMKTIDKGLEQIPKAFAPTLKGRVHYNRKISKLSHTTDSKVRVSWDRKFKSSATYDYAIIAVPFSQVRKWRLPPLTPLLQHAINNLAYSSACKVALQFRTRFWEHLPKNPIYGGCTSTDLPGIGSFCYPSYRLNSTGPGVLLASYTDGENGQRYVSLTDKEHVEHVLDAMTEIHGPVAEEQYTGKFSRQCWLLDPHASASWAQPTVGQHALYIPEFFKTVNNTIFIGEHTSYTHAWIASALESAIRGAVQLCLDLGLVDEAKTIVETWMSRWIDI
ncbi:flavin-containing amine oxidoreductase-domain containing protein [Geopyxis carbonaria]|nr:flavin-containing amine oxidoreductase-domain containing protein [Geopyxis carbonaria]